MRGLSSLKQPFGTSLVQITVQHSSSLLLILLLRAVPANEVGAKDEAQEECE